MRFLVWVDDWQLQCCGDPFSVGSEVTWTLSHEPDREWLTEVIGAAFASSVTHAEEHHGGLPESWPRTTGRVTAIRSVFCRYAPVGTDSRTLSPVPGSGRLHDIDRADGRETS